MKPFSQACQNNRDPILSVLIRVFADRRRVLEIGSGTGQHAVYFARHLPHLQWYTSDLEENHPGIRAWLKECPRENLHPPRALDVTVADWGMEPVDAVYSANTVHIMAWPAVEKMFAGLAGILPPKGVFALYGPFNYEGEYTSDSNRRFDTWLKAQAEHRGIRDFERVDALARGIGLELVEDNALPANNRLLVWRRGSMESRE